MTEELATTRFFARLRTFDSLPLIILRNRLGFKQTILILSGMVTKKGIKTAVKHDLEAAGHDAKVAGKDAEKALKTAGRDVKKAGQKVRKKL